MYSSLDNSHTGFLSLSPELRNEIYELIYPSDGPLVFSEGSLCFLPNATNKVVARKPLSYTNDITALAFVCRQTYRDLALRPFSNNIIYFESLMALALLYHQLADQQCEAIRHIHLSTWLSDQPSVDRFFRHVKDGRWKLSGMFPNIKKVTIRPLGNRPAERARALQVHGMHFHERTWQTTTHSRTRLDKWFQSGLRTDFEVEWDEKEFAKLRPKGPKKFED